MGGLEDAVERGLAAQKGADEAAQLEAERRDQARERAEDYLFSQLQELAEYLGTKLEPRRLMLGKTGLLGLRANSPVGFVWLDEHNSAGSYFRTQMLLPTGDIWMYSLSGGHYSPPSRKLRGRGSQLRGALRNRYSLFGYYFSVEPDGNLLVQREYGREDNSTPYLYMEDVKTSLALEFIRRHEGPSTVTR